MLEAQLSMPRDSLPDSCFLGPAKGLQAQHACQVRVESILPRGRRLRHLVEVSGKKPLELVNVIAVRGIRSASHPVSRTSYLCIVDTPLCPLYEALVSTPCFPLRETVHQESLSWDVIAESESAVNVLLSKLKRGGVRARVVKTMKINGGKRLSDRQEAVLRLASDRGFFESPHRTSVRQLAKTFDCSPSTLIRILRKAEKKVIAAKLGRLSEGLVSAS